MVITKRSLLQHELIGLEAKVMDSSDPTLSGTSGKIVDETRNMLVMEQEGKIKKIPKFTSKFLMVLPNGEKMSVNGKQLVGRPEERVRRKR